MKTYWEQNRREYEETKKADREKNRAGSGYISTKPEHGSIIDPKTKASPYKSKPPPEASE